jgi:BlaI family penicillinase repressor
VGILQVLWQLSSGTVRQVHEKLGGDTGYTSTLKLMQIMFEKGLLTRVAQGRLHVYRPAQAQARTQRRLAGDLIERAFGGSAGKLIVAALDSHRATPQELAEIRRLIEEAELRETKGDDNVRYADLCSGAAPDLFLHAGDTITVNPAPQKWQGASTQQAVTP